MTGTPTIAVVSRRRTPRRDNEALRTASSMATVNSTTCSASTHRSWMNADSR